MDWAKLSQAEPSWAKLSQAAREFFGELKNVTFQNVKFVYILQQYTHTLKKSEKNNANGIMHFLKKYIAIYHYWKIIMKYCKIMKNIDIALVMH